MDKHLAHELAVATFKFTLDFHNLDLTIIHGVRGSGKTQLAYYLLEEYKKKEIRASIIEHEGTVYSLSLYKEVIRRLHGGLKVITTVQSLDGIQTSPLLYSADLIIRASSINFDRSLSFYGT